MADVIPAATETEPKPPEAEEPKPAAPVVETKPAEKRTLVQKLEDRKAAIRAAADKPATTTAAPTATDTTPAPNGKPEETTENLIGLVREQRRIEREKKALESATAAAKETEPDIARVRTARELLAKGDRLGAVKVLLPGVDITKDLLWDLTKAIEAGEIQPSEPPGQEQDVARLVAAEVERIRKAEADARTAAERKAAEEHHAAVTAHDAQLGQGFGATVVAVTGLGNVDTEVLAPVLEGYAEYVQEVGKAFDPAKYPAIQHFGAGTKEIVEAHLKLHQAGKGEAIAPEAVLKAIEDALVAKIKAAGYGPPAVTVPKPAPNVTGAWRSDPGRPAPAEGKPKTYEEKRQERMAKLRAAGAK